MWHIGIEQSLSSMQNKMYIARVDERNGKQVYAKVTFVEFQEGAVIEPCFVWSRGSTFLDQMVDACGAKVLLQEYKDKIKQLELVLKLQDRHLTDMRKMALGTIGDVALDDEDKNLMGAPSTNAPRRDSIYEDFIQPPPPLQEQPIDPRTPSAVRSAVDALTGLGQAHPPRQRRT